MNRSGEVEAEFTIPIEGLVHEAFGVARHSNGTMYIALTGSRGKAGSEDDFIAVARLGADNLPDPTFGVDGICEVSFASRCNTGHGRLGYIHGAKGGRRCCCHCSGQNCW